MALSPSTIRLDLKCGNGAISPGEECHKGSAQKVDPKASTPRTTVGLEKLPTKALKEHRYRLFDDLIKKYPKKIKTEEDYKKWRSWAAEQPENEEANAVGQILERRRKRGQRVFAGAALAGTAGALLTAGALSGRLRRDAFIGNKTLNCGPGSKPCGNACIPKAHKCRASWNKPVKLVAGAAALTGAAVVGTAFLHPRAKMRQAAREILEPTLQAGFGVGNLAQGNWVGAAKNAANVAATGQNLGRNLWTLGQGYASDLQSLYNKGREAAFKARHHRPAAKRRDAEGIACGQGHISRGKTCRKKGAFPTRKAIAAGLTVAAVGVGAFALSRRNNGSGQPAGGTPTPPQLPGLTPKGLLKAAPKPKSKTQRMRENTAAAMRNAEGRIAQTAREEVRRVAQIGNTMAAAGEATGMAFKTTLRELRLRTEAARRRFEPGYRSTPPTAPKAPAQLPEGGSAFQAPVNPKRTRPPEYVEELGQLSPNELRQWISTDPRTGQPKRRKAQGFGRSTRDNYIPHYATTYIDPARQRGDDCWEGYVQAGMKRKGKKEVPNCVPASSGLAKPKAQEDAEHGKKYIKVVTNPETGRKNKVRYGAKGYKIAPGTDKGDRYCARSFGDMQSEGYDCSGAERNTPLCLSRAKWKCSGKTSRRDGLTPGKFSA